MRRLIPVIVLAAAVAAGSYVGFRRATPRPVRVENALIVSFLDESLGCAILIETPEKDFIVVDPGPELTADRLVEYLHQIGARSVDVILTTPRPEHAGALQALLKSMEVKRVIRGWNTLVKPESLPAADGLVELVMSTGDKVKLSPAVSVEALGPPDTAPDSDRTRPLISRVRFGRTTFLLMSDATIEDEAYLMRSGADLTSTVLVVSNHARAGGTSLELLAKVRPHYCIALVETGDGRPDRAVMKRISTENTGAYLYRTDKDGIIDLVSDGRSVMAPSKGGVR